MSPVKVIFSNPEKVKAQVRRSFIRLAEKHTEIKKVILFGSYANGTFVPHSDVDILLILNFSEHPFPDRIPIYLPDDLGLPVDVFPYTVAEMNSFRKSDNLFIRRVHNEGVVLYDREKDANIR